MYKIAIANQKGGVGKTTSTIEMAATLHDQGLSVIVVDMDQQCNLTAYTAGVSTVAEDGTELPTVYDVFDGTVSARDAVQHGEFYDIIPASPKLSKAERTFISPDSPYLLAAAMDELEGEGAYDVALFDNNPTRNILLSMAYIAADYVVIPCECDEGSFSGVRFVMSDIDSLKKARGGALTHARVAGFILNKYENTNMHKTALEQMREIAGQVAQEQGTEHAPAVCTVTKGIVASEVKLYRRPLQGKKKYSTVATDFRRACGEIIDRMMEMEEESCL